MLRFIKSLLTQNNRKPRKSLGQQALLRGKALCLECLEDRLVPTGFFLTGVGGFTNPAQPNVRFYNAFSDSGNTSTVLPPGDLAAFPGGFAGSVRVANGDVNGDGYDDFITAQGPGTGSGSLVKIFDGRSALVLGSRVEIASFFVYSDTPGASQTPGFGGGVFVATGDFNHDGWDELVVTAGAGARGHVKVFDFHGAGDVFLGSTPVLRTSFFAYTDFAGEIRVTTLRANGTTYLVTGSGAGTTQTDVRLYADAFTIGEVPDLTFVNPFQQTFPFPGFLGGVSVAAGDTDGDGNEELFVSTSVGPATVSVFDIRNLSAPKYTFDAFPGFLGEVRLGAADVNGDGRVEVLTSTGDSPGAEGAHVKAWTLVNGTPQELRSFFAYAGYINGVFLSTRDFTTTYDYANFKPLAIPDDGSFVFSLTTISASIDNNTLLRARSVEIDLNITATSGSANGDLEVFLKSPSSGSLALFTGVNGNGAGFAVTLSDRAVTNVGSPAGVPGVRLTGKFKPKTGNLLAQFGNSPISGNWILALRDVSPNGNTFRLDSWVIRLSF